MLLDVSDEELFKFCLDDCKKLFYSLSQRDQEQFLPIFAHLWYLLTKEQIPYTGYSTLGPNGAHVTWEYYEETKREEANRRSKMTQEEIEKEDRNFYLFGLWIMSKPDQCMLIPPKD